MSSRTSPATIESRIVAGFVWLLAGWTICVHLAVVSSKSFSQLVGFTPIALLIASAGLALTWRNQPGGEFFESRRPSSGWFGWGITGGLVLLCLLFGYSLFWALATTFIITAWWFTRDEAGEAVPHSTPQNRRADGVRLVALCTVAIALPLLLHQPDKDDSFYLSVATDAVRHPDRAIWSTDTIHDNVHLPVFLPIYKTEAFEHLIAITARTAHCTCIRADHTLLPILLAIFVMLSWTMLARTIDPANWFGIAVTALLIMLLAGATRSSPANFAFTRLQQGKSVFAAGIVPVLCVYAWRVVSTGGWRHVLLLIAAQIAGVGVSSTAILIGPLVVMAIAILAVPLRDFSNPQTPVLRYAEEPDSTGKTPGSSEYLRTGGVSKLLRIFFVGISCIYPFALALLMQKQMLAVKWIAASPMHHTGDEVKKVLGNGPQLWFFLACMLLGWRFVPRQNRRLILAPIVLLLTILINPLFTRFLQSNIFSPLTYWRGMWVVPWPIWSAAAVYGLANGGQIRKAAVFITVILLLIWHPLVSRQNDTYFHFGGLSVDPDEYAVAQQLAQQTPPGTSALAPELVACWTASLDQRPPLIFVRPYYTQPNPIPGFDDADMRNLLGNIAGKSNLTTQDCSALLDGIGQYRLGAIVLRIDAGEIATQTLKRAGFDPTITGYYVIWKRIRQPKTGA